MMEINLENKNHASSSKAGIYIALTNVSKKIQALSIFAAYTETYHVNCNANITSFMWFVKILKIWSFMKNQFKIG